MDQRVIFVMRGVLLVSLVLAGCASAGGGQTTTEPSPGCPVTLPCECRGNRLICNDKNLLKIPEFLPSDYEWYELHLEVNYIAAVPADSFSGLIVKKIYLHMNRISRIDPNAFRGVKGVNMLEMGLNEIATIPTQLFAPLSELKTLNIPNNQIETLDGDIFTNNQQLEQLQVNDNRLRDVPVQALRQLTQLRRLYLQNNEISDFPAFSFATLPLQILHLENNGAPVHLSPKTFCGMRTTSSSRRHGNVAPQKAFGGLYKLSLQNNGIKSLHPCMFDDLPTLASLNLEGNDLSCDCDLFYLSHRHLRGEMRMQFGHSRCASPDSLKGREVTSVREHEYTCDWNVIRDRCERNAICATAYHVTSTSASHFSYIAFTLVSFAWICAQSFGS